MKDLRDLNNLTKHDGGGHLTASSRPLAPFAKLGQSYASHRFFFAEEGE